MGLLMWMHSVGGRLKSVSARARNLFWDPHSGLEIVFISSVLAAIDGLASPDSAVFCFGVFAGACIGVPDHRRKESKPAQEEARGYC